MSNNAERPQGGNFVSRWLTEKKEQKLAKARAEAHLAAETAAQPARKKITEASITSIDNISSHLGSRVDVGTVGWIEKTSAFGGDFFTISFQDTEENLISFNHLSTKIIQEKDAHFQKMNVIITEQDVERLQLLTGLVSESVSLINTVYNLGNKERKKILVEDYSDVLEHSYQKAFIFEGQVEKEQFRVTSGKISENTNIIVVQRDNQVYVLQQEKDRLRSIQKIVGASNDEYNPQESEKYTDTELKAQDIDYLSKVIQALPHAQPTGWSDGLSSSWHSVNYGAWLSEEQINQINYEVEKKHAHTILINQQIKLKQLQRETDRKKAGVPKNNEIRREIFPINQSIQEYKQVAIEIPWTHLWKELGTYYREDAHAIMEMVTKGTGVIVNAPCGAGKTKLLTPEIKHLAREQGWAIGEKTDFPDSGSFQLLEEYEYAGNFENIVADIYPDASLELRKLFIVDEVAKMGIESLDQTEALFSYLRKNNISTILLNAAPQEKMRIQATQGMIEIANKVGFPLTTYEQKQKGFFPIDIVKKYLGDWNIEPALLDFLTHPDNDAFRDLRLFSIDLIPAIVKESAIGIAPIRTLAQLRSYASERRETWMRQLRGGSKETLVRGLKNLDVIKSSDQSFIDRIEDYN